MKIFKSEKDIQGKILASKTSATILPYRISTEKKDSLISSLKAISKLDDKLGQAVAVLAASAHPDLMYGVANLVSTTMNLNDDVFLPEETWKARNTPVNTPYNDDHLETNIIGHIIAAKPTDKEGKLIDQEDAPDYFDIEVDWVVYKSIYPAIAEEIADKGPKGEKFVSMECFFNDFDYALIDSDGKSNAQIIKRNEETAFLTKHLRAYGGEGQYGNKKIGRVLRDFRFSGMGSVDVPANPTSSIKKVEYASSKLIKSIAGIQKTLYINKGNTMVVETVEQANKIISDLEDKVKTLEATASKVTKLGEDNTSLANDLTVEKEKIGVANQKVQDLEKQMEALKADLTKAQSDLKEKVDALDQINKEAKANERVSALKELGINVDDEKRKSIADWSDDQFKSLIEFTKSISTKKDETNTASDDIDKDKADADKKLKDAKENEEGHVEATEGDTSTSKEKLEKTSATLASVLMKHRKSNKSKE